MRQDMDVARMAAALGTPSLKYRSFGNEAVRKQPGDEQDMAAAILYLAGVGGKYLNGNVIVVDGGRLGVQPAVY